MKFTATQRWALFLCLLVLNHHMIEASHVHRLDDGTMKMAASVLDRESSDLNEDMGVKVEYPAPDMNLVDDTQDASKLLYDDDDADYIIPAHRNSTSGLERHGKAQKRFFFLLALLIVSIVTTVVATVIEHIYDSKGCCGVGYGYLCGFEGKFNRKKKGLTSRLSVVNSKLSKAKKDKEIMGTISDDLYATAKYMKEIHEIKVKLLEALDKGITDSLETSITAQEEKLEKEKTAVNLLSVNQGIGKLDKTMNYVLTWSTGVALPAVTLIASTAYKKFKVAKVFTGLKRVNAIRLTNGASKATKSIGLASKISKGLMKFFGISKFAMKFGKIAKIFKLFKGFGAVISIIGIGFDIYSIVNVFIECGKKRTKARDAMGELDKSEVQINGREREVKDFQGKLDTVKRDNIIPAVRKDDFHSGLTDVRNTINLLNGRKVDTSKCTSFDQKIQKLKTSNNLAEISSALDHVKRNCVTVVKTVLTCVLKKTKLIDRVVDGCRKGTGTFDQLYATAKDVPELADPQNKCVDETKQPMLSKQHVSTILTRAATAEGFDLHCPNNNDDLVYPICSLKTDKLVAFYARKLKKKPKFKQIDCTPTMFAQIRARYCPTGKTKPLSAKDKEIVCQMLRAGIPGAKIQNAYPVSEYHIKHVQCPMAPGDVMPTLKWY